MGDTMQFIHGRLNTLREEKKALEAKIEAFECVLMELENQNTDKLNINVRLSSKTTNSLARYNIAYDTKELIDKLENLSIERSEYLEDIEYIIDNVIDKYNYNDLFLYIKDDCELFHLIYNTYYLEIDSDGNACITLEFN